MSVKIEKTTGQAPETTGAALPARDTAHPLVSLRDEIDRLFDSFFNAPFGRMFEIDPFRRFGTLVPTFGGITPRVDVRETEAAFEITAELPGLAEKDVEVTLSDDVLAIRGEKKTEHEEKKADYHLSERSYGVFHRTFRLPDTVDQERIAATFEKGVLSLTLPKSEKAAKQAKKIEVKGK